MVWALLLGGLGAGCDLLPEEREAIPPEHEPDSPDTGRVGDPITLASGDTELRVVLRKVLDPAPSGPADRTLDPGGRFVGVRLSVKNIGERRFSSSLASGARLLTTRGPAPSAGLLSGPCELGFGSNVDLAPGESAAGCITFEVKRNARPQRFTLALASGFADEVGVWRLE